MSLWSHSLQESVLLNVGVGGCCIKVWIPEVGGLFGGHLGGWLPQFRWIKTRNSLTFETYSSVNKYHYQEILLLISFVAFSFFSLLLHLPPCLISTTVLGQKVGLQFLPEEAGTQGLSHLLRAAQWWSQQSPLHWGSCHLTVSSSLLFLGHLSSSWPLPIIQ